MATNSAIYNIIRYWIIVQCLGSSFNNIPYQHFVLLSVVIYNMVFEMYIYFYGSLYSMGFILQAPPFKTVRDNN